MLDYCTQQIRQKHSVHNTKKKELMANEDSPTKINFMFVTYQT